VSGIGNDTLIYIFSSKLAIGVNDEGQSLILNF